MLCTFLEAIAGLLTIGLATVQSMGPDAVLMIKCLEITGNSVRDLLHSGPVALAACKVLGDGSGVVVRHAADKRPAIEVEVTSVAQAMHRISGALQARSVRPTRCVNQATAQSHMSTLEQFLVCLDLIMLNSGFQLGS
jgi:hypothetical protein